VDTLSARIVLLHSSTTENNGYKHQQTLLKWLHRLY